MVCSFASALSKIDAAGSGSGDRFLDEDRVEVSGFTSRDRRESEKTKP
jgi:hypothetical protein